MKLKVKNVVATITIAGVITSAFVVTAILNRKNTAEKEAQATVSQSSENKSKLTGTEEEKQGIIDMLAAQGVDKNKLEEEYKTDNGGTILGDALPAKAYRTLHEAESAFGYYLGLHNKLESLTEYQLVDMHIINNEFMQGTYENGDGKKSISVKTSKKKTEQELIKVYKEHNYNSTIEIQGIKVNMAGESKDKINLASFTVPNKKSYSINTTAGLTPDEMNRLVDELIGNLKIMDDWVD